MSTFLVVVLWGSVCCFLAFNAAAAWTHPRLLDWQRLLFTAMYLLGGLASAMIAFQGVAR